MMKDKIIPIVAAIFLIVVGISSGGSGEETTYTLEASVDKESYCPGEYMILYGTVTSSDGVVHFPVVGYTVEGPAFRLGQLDGDINGDFNDSIFIPESANPGTYNIIVAGSGLGTSDVVEYNVEVCEPPEGPKNDI